MQARSSKFSLFQGVLQPRRYSRDDLQRAVDATGIVVFHCRRDRLPSSGMRTCCEIRAANSPPAQRGQSVSVWWDRLGTARRLTSLGAQSAQVPTTPFAVWESDRLVGVHRPSGKSNDPSASHSGAPPRATSGTVEQLARWTPLFRPPSL